MRVVLVAFVLAVASVAVSAQSVPPTYTYYGNVNVNGGLFTDAQSAGQSVCTEGGTWTFNGSTFTSSNLCFSYGVPYEGLSGGCSAPETVHTGTICRTLACPSGYSYNGSTNMCDPATTSGPCTSLVDQVVDFTGSVSGTNSARCWNAGGTVGPKVCATVSSGGSTQNCRAALQTCDTMGAQLADGTQRTVVGGIAKIVNEGCSSADMAAYATSAPRADNPSGSSGNVSAGGAGTVAGTTQSQDSINAARTATNTKEIADLLRSGVGGGSTTVNMCGSPGQPACVIDEGSTGESGTNTSANINDAQSSMASSLDGRASAISNDPAKVPGFVPSEGRWSFALTPFVPGSSCTWVLPAFNAGPVHLASVGTFSVCDWADTARAFFYWSFALMTCAGLWFILFRR